MNILILYQLRKEANNFRKIKNSKTQEKSIIEKKLEEINNEVNQYKLIFKNYTDIFFSKIIKATSKLKPDTPFVLLKNLIRISHTNTTKTFLGQ